MSTRDRIGSLLRGLYVDRDNGWIAGVCAGMAHRFDVDINVLRIVTAACAWFATVPTALLYGLAAVLLEDRPLVAEDPAREREFWRSGSRRRSYR